MKTKIPNTAHIAKLKEEAETFSKNMSELGVLLKQLKAQYSSIEERITQLEKEMNSVIISVDRLEDMHI